MEKIPPEASVTNDLKRVYVTLFLDKAEYMKDLADQRVIL